MSDASTLLAEVIRLSVFSEDFTKQILARVQTLATDMEALEKENARLRKISESTYFERDACIGLIARLAKLQGMPVGTALFEQQRRVVVDLPSGQVSWEYLEAEAHLFADLPSYERTLENQTVSEVYSKVMNPNLEEESPHGEASGNA